MTKRRPHRHVRQETAVQTPGGPRQSVGTLAGNTATTPGDVGIGGDDMFGANSAAQGTGDTGKINIHGAGDDQAGFGTTAGGASDPLGGATTGVGSTFGTTEEGTDVSRGEGVEPEPPSAPSYDERSA